MVRRLFGIYSVHFPYMDKNSYMSNPPTTPDETYSTTSNDVIALAIKTLKLMLPRSEMACGWSVWMKRMGRYFENIKKDCYRSIESLGLPSSEHQRRVRELSLREGPNAGSLEDRYDSPDRFFPFSAAATGVSRPAPHFKTEPAQALDHVRSASRNGTEGGWAAVNTTTPLTTAPLRKNNPFTSNTQH
ncbi:hypothetical protein VE00_07265 [Pseudogymnoascus sp. WSF 3629]|nr:hypothetical protein VE00_07265 [Pseudogymnoascus sp. WSF 3629]